MTTEEVIEEVIEEVSGVDDTAPVVLIEAPDLPTPAEVGDMAEVEITSDAQRIVEIARAESEAAIIRAESDVKVHKILAPIIGAEEEDEAPGEFDDPAPAPQSETAPRATHWYRRRIGGK